PARQRAGLCVPRPRHAIERSYNPARRAMPADQRADAARIFDAWEAELVRSGGPRLAGTLSLADLAFVPTAVRLQAHAPDMAQWPRSAAWMEALLARASVREWVDEARTLPPVLLDGYR